MIGFTRLALASTLALGLAVPAFAQTDSATTAPAASAPDQATPDSGIKPAAPDAAPVKSTTRHHHSHVKHAAKTPAPTAAKS